MARGRIIPFGKYAYLRDTLSAICAGVVGPRPPSHGQRPNPVAVRSRMTAAQQIGDSTRGNRRAALP